VLSFTDLAATPEPPLDELVLAIACDLRDADVVGAIARLDVLGDEVARALESTARLPEDEVRVLAEVLGDAHGFEGEREHYDDPSNSMLDLVLERRRGLPILLSVVYVEVARRAEIALAGVGLPGHFVAGHFGESPPLLLDPFGGGARVTTDADPAAVRPWTPHETAMRVLNNLVRAYGRRGDLAAALRAAELRVELPAGDAQRATVQAELRALRARLN
jgi:regulator of sirC expression with transglutaminase-like and TPR domain